MALMLTDTPSVVFEKYSVDIIGPLSASEPGIRYILTVQDDLSKFLIAVPMRGQTAEEVSKAFVENVILAYGLPQVILSDCGASFLSDTFMGICKLLGIKKIKTTPFRPESNGSDERSRRSLTEYIRSL
jgi:transposase InsO family protein